MLTFGVARFMASMLQVREPPDTLRILDPGGGSGVLTAAAVAELCNRPERSRPAALHATVWELDARLAGDLDRTFEHCHAVCAKAGVAFRSEHRRGSFVLDAAVRADDQDLLEPERHPRFHRAAGVRLRGLGAREPAHPAQRLSRRDRPRRIDREPGP